MLKYYFLTFLASVATQQTISNKISNPECPHGYIKFAHRCIREQPKNVQLVLSMSVFFNNTIGE